MTNDHGQWQPAGDGTTVPWLFRVNVVVSVTIAVLVIAACAAPGETYVVMPDGEGRTEPLTVTARGGQSIVLDKPYAAAVGSARAIDMVPADRAAVEKNYGDTLSVQPLPPRTFILYFSEGEELTVESKAELEKVFAEIAGRPAPDIMVVGHTDRVGKVEDNDALSWRRADKVKLELISRGLAADGIQTAGRGEREPRVSTADEIREPQNRRVEVSVR